jgi:thiol-disulfide isomerase/thioredoxin
MKIILFLSLLSLFSCTKKVVMPQSGIWRLSIASSGGAIPALIELKYGESHLEFYLLNGPDRIQLASVEDKKGHLTVPMQIFNSEFIFDDIKEYEMKGVWRRNDRNPVVNIPITLSLGKGQLFDQTKKAALDISGKWKMTMNPKSEDEKVALGIFKQTGDKVSGTILTKTGDFRYLEGVVSDSDILLSTFDGSFAYLLRGKFKNGEIVGNLYSPTSGQAFIAQKTDQNILPDPTSLTKIKINKKFTFSFPDLKGKLVNLEDSQFKNKPVIVQIFGSWCPNCMDETAFLSQWDKDNKLLGVKIVALAFERAGTMEEAITNVRKSVDHFQTEYIYLVASYNAEKTPDQLLPIDGLVSYPTTIFLDKNHQVVKVHTGFAGPATGDEYTKFIKMFNDTVEKSLR